jgi:NitT/TauT family transport system permease protein
MSDAVKLALARGALLIALLVGWELFGRLVDSTWTSQPTDIAAQIATWAGDGLAWHIAVTLIEMAIGLAIGAPGGILLGLWLGRSPRVAGLL